MLTESNKAAATQHSQRRLRLAKRRSGATLFEYTVIVALVSIAAIVVLSSIGKTTNTKLETVPAGFQ